MDVATALSDFRPILPTRSLPKGSKEATIIAVAAQKGGVGKTTTAVHLAAGLAAAHDRKVLLVDLDHQGHVGMSLRRSLNPSKSERLGELLLGRRRDLFEIAEESTHPGLWTVASDPQLNECEERMSSRIGKELLLRQALKVARTHFDLIVLDCPPNLGALTVNALVAADQVLIPCDLSLLSLDGVAAMVETVFTVQESLNPDLDILGLVRTRVDRRNQTVNGAIEAILQARYGSTLLTSEIGASTDITKAQLEGKPVFHHAPKGRGSAAYLQLCHEVDRKLFGPALI